MERNTLKQIMYMSFLICGLCLVVSNAALSAYVGRGVWWIFIILGGIAGLTYWIAFVLNIRRRRKE